MEKDLKIFKSKTLADGSKYFSLFEKHIPALNAGSSVYLYMLGNLHCICEIIQKNPNSKYFICDADEVIKAVQIMMDNIDISKTVDLYDIDMKFDCIIMNPPYQKNLHLKILAEAIKHLKDDESKVVNLSPVRWLQDPLAKYKKNSDYHRFEESVAKHIEIFNIIESAESNNIFSAGIMTDLAIYLCNKHSIGIVKCYTNAIIDKVLSSGIKMLSDVVEYKKRDGWRWQISELQPLNAQGGEKYSYGWYRRFCIFNHLRSTIYNNGFKDGKDWTTYTSGVKNDSTCSLPLPHSIKFNSEIAANNFENSVKTLFYKYFVLQVKTDQHTPFKFLPWMGDAINPRTGLKGYESEWTDEDFFSFFNIAPEEQEIINKTMEKYK